MSKELEDKVKDLKIKIKEQEEILASLLAKALGSKRCEWCGCPDGIHKSSCKFIVKYCN